MKGRKNKMKFFDEFTKKRNNLYLIRNKHKHLVYVSNIPFYKETYDLKTIENFYEEISNIQGEKVNLSELLKEEVVEMDCFFTNHQIPLHITALQFDINKTKYYLEHYELFDDRDPLTLLPTRTTLTYMVKDLIVINKPFQLLYMDFDHFSKYNETIGYVKTDLILQRITELMEEHTYPNKVFRYGGDEFIILFYEEVNISEEMTFFRDKIRKIQLLEKFDFSYGVSSYPKRASLEQLIAEASNKMKLHKKRKTNLK